MRRCLLVAALVLVGAAPAHGAVTTSNVTSPANGTTYFQNTNAALPITVTGTSNGTGADEVQLRCYYGSGLFVGGPTAPVAGDGSFTINAGSDVAYGRCVLRAVPNGFSNTADPSAFTGPTVTGEAAYPIKVSGGGPNDGKVIDFFAQYQGAQAFNDFYSTGDGGLYDTRLQTGADNSTEYLWYGNAALYVNENLSADNRAFLRIDNRNAYLPGAATSIASANDNAGLPALDVVFEPRSANGDIAIREAGDAVRCGAPDDAFPPTAASCPSFDATGVRLERRIETIDGGRQTRIVDTWRSTDGQPHQLSIHYDNPHDSFATTTGPFTNGFQFPWAGEFRTYADGDTVPAAPGAPASIFVRSSNAEPNGASKHALGALTFDTPPNAARFASASDFRLAYERTVPAGGTTTIRQDYVIGANPADVAAKAAASEDRMGLPAVAFAAPANGAVVTSPAVTLTGTATDNKAVTLTINGAPVTPGAGGAFSHPVVLQRGDNTFTATAKDAAGNSATATVTVRYNDVTAPGVTAASLLRTTFRVGPQATPTIAAARAGTAFRLTLTEDARVAIAISRVLPGRKRGSRCVKPTRALRKRKRCDRLAARGTLTRSLKAGASSVAFSGRIGRKKLAPGRYVARLTATDVAGNRSAAKTLRFRIVKR